MSRVITVPRCSVRPIDCAQRGERRDWETDARLNGLRGSGGCITQIGQERCRRCVSKPLRPTMTSKGHRGEVEARSLSGRGGS